jgi:hypothetical protein
LFPFTTFSEVFGLKFLKKKENVFVNRRFASSAATGARRGLLQRFGNKNIRDVRFRVG